MTNVYKNPRDTGQAEQGVETERLFEAAANAAGWQVEPAPAHQDYEQHIDCTLVWAVIEPSLHGSEVVQRGAEFTVDVKSDSQSDLVWVEMRNVDGDAGWLYGKADLIAFARDSGFLMVDREKLKTWIEENVERTYVTNKNDALMKVYTRDGRKDMLTRVQNYHLVGLSDGKIPYA